MSSTNQLQDTWDAVKDVNALGCDGSDGSGDHIALRTYYGLEMQFIIEDIDPFAGIDFAEVFDLSATEAFVMNELLGSISPLLPMGIKSPVFDLIKNQVIQMLTGCLAPCRPPRVCTGMYWAKRWKTDCPWKKGRRRRMRRLSSGICIMDPTAGLAMILGREQTLWKNWAIGMKDKINNLGGTDPSHSQPCMLLP